MENMRFKVGDRVRIKSLDWYNANKDEDGNVVCLYSYFDMDMSEFCNKIVTIKSLHGCPNVKAFRIIEDDGYSWWSDDMIEGLVEDTITTNEPLFKLSNISLEKEMEWNLPDGYQFVDENSNVINATKIVLEKKEKGYPKTYEECAKIMNCPIAGPSGWLFNFDANIKDPYYRKIDILMGKFTRLLICRDAYWKLYGEEMGLGKPWEPDWNGKLYYLYYNPTNTTGVVRGFTSDGVLAYVVLAFPTEEMRDAFYENFKEEIEICKEFL